MIPAVVTHCAGIDIGKRVLAVCLMVGPADAEPKVEVREFSAFTADLEAMKEWLKQAGCTHVVMESTGPYWKPVFNVLEGSMVVCLANAEDVKGRKGHKTDRIPGHANATAFGSNIGTTARREAEAAHCATSPSLLGSPGNLHRAEEDLRRGRRPAAWTPPAQSTKQPIRAVQLIYFRSKPLPSFPGFRVPTCLLQFRSQKHRNRRAAAQRFGGGLLPLPPASARL